jgi:hypothetical protein
MGPAWMQHVLVCAALTPPPVAPPPPPPPITAMCLPAHRTHRVYPGGGQSPTQILPDSTAYLLFRELKWTVTFPPPRSFAESSPVILSHFRQKSLEEDFARRVVRRDAEHGVMFFVRVMRGLHAFERACVCILGTCAPFMPVISLLHISVQSSGGRGGGQSAMLACMDAPRACG